MALSVVNKKQNAGAASGTLAITSATAGNLLVAFIAQSGTTSAPKGKDNISGETGWTVNATSAVGNTSANSLFVATKIAVGAETELNPTVGAGGVIQGIAYFEVSGGSATLHAGPVKTDNPGNVSTATSGAVTTTDAGALVLAAVGFPGAGNSGTVTAWTGTGPMTNVETTGTRCLGGYYLPGTTLSAVTFTANWTTSRQVEMLAVAIGPLGGVVLLHSAGKLTTASGVVWGGVNPALKSAGRLTVASKVPDVRLRSAGKLTVASEAVPLTLRLRSAGKLTIVSSVPPEQGEPPEGELLHEARLKSAGRLTVAGERLPGGPVTLKSGGRLTVVSYQRPQSSPTLHSAGRLRVTSGLTLGMNVTLHSAGRLTVVSFRFVPAIQNRRTAEPGQVAVGQAGRIDV